MNMVGVNINANVICSLGVLIVGFAMLIKGADLFVEGEMCIRDSDKTAVA